MAEHSQATIAPTRRDVECWRLSAEWVIKFGGVKLGEFNWPQAILSLAVEWERNNASAVVQDRTLTVQMCSSKPDTTLRRALERIAESNVHDQPAESAGDETVWIMRHVSNLRRIATDALQESVISGDEKPHGMTVCQLCGTWRRSPCGEGCQWGIVSKTGVGFVVEE